MSTPQRILRRVTRTVGTAPAESNKREDAIKEIEQHLQAIANLKIQIGALQDSVNGYEDKIGALMGKHAIVHVASGTMEALIKDKFSNEKKEIDPKKLFSDPRIKREDYFGLVKVQMDALKKILGETEIRAMSKITPPTKTGTELVIQPVKQTVSKTLVRSAKK